jgi:hypothetical protein
MRSMQSGVPRLRTHQGQGKYHNHAGLWLNCLWGNGREGGNKESCRNMEYGFTFSMDLEMEKLLQKF